MNKTLIARVASNTKRATATHAALVDALKARIVFDEACKLDRIGKNGQPLAVSPEWAHAMTWATRDAAGSIRQIAALGKGFDFAHFVQCLSVVSEGDKFVATKVVRKVLCFVSALFEQNPRTATDYAVQIIFNALHNGGELNIEGVQGSLSRRVIVAPTVNLASRGAYTTGTASAQGSQVRMLANYLRFAEVSKGKRADIMRIKPEVMGDLRELFGVTEGDEGDDTNK